MKIRNFMILAAVAAFLTMGVAANAQNKPAKPAAAATIDGAKHKMVKHVRHHHKAKKAAADSK